MRLLSIVYVIYVFITSLIIGNIYNLHQLQESLNGVYMTPLVYDNEQTINESIDIIDNISKEQNINTLTYVLSNDIYYVYTTDQTLTADKINDALKVDFTIEIRPFEKLYDDFLPGVVLNLFYYGKGDINAYQAQIAEYYRLDNTFDFAYIYAYNSDVRTINQLYSVYDVILILIMITLAINYNIKYRREKVIKSLFVIKNNLTIPVIILCGIFLSFLNVWLLTYLLPLIIIYIITKIQNIGINYAQVLLGVFNSKFMHILTYTSLTLLKILQLVLLSLLLLLLPSFMAKIQYASVVDNISDYSFLELTYFNDKNMSEDELIDYRYQAEQYFIDNYDAFYMYKYDASCYGRGICSSIFANNGIILNYNTLKLQNNDLEIDPNLNYLIVPTHLSDQVDQITNDVYDLLQIDDDIKFEIVIDDNKLFSYNVQEPSYINPILLVTNNTDISADITTRSYQGMYFDNPDQTAEIIKDYYDLNGVSYQYQVPVRNLAGVINTQISYNLHKLVKTIIVLLLLIITIIVINNMYISQYIAKKRSELSIHFLITGKHTKYLTRLFIKLYFIDFIMYLIIGLVGYLIGNLLVSIVLVIVHLVFSLINIYFCKKQIYANIIEGLKGYND